MKKYVTWKKSDIILRSMRSHVLTGWVIDRTEFGCIVHCRHFIDWYHDFIYLISSSGNDMEVLLWTVTVSSITFRGSEGKFDRLIYKLTTVTNYTRPTRFILRVLDCQKLCRFIVWLSVIYIVIIDNRKFNFLESLVLFLLLFQILPA